MAWLSVRGRCGSVFRYKEMGGIFKGKQIYLRDSMIRIMFVCHGNICRSPMAEFIFKTLVEEKGLSDSFYIASSATSTEEIWGGKGNPVYPPARAELARHGIGCEGKRAVQLCRADTEKYDMFIGMDSANIRNMKRMLGEGVQDKIYKLMSFTGSDADVSDPWYSDRFDVAYADIRRGCEALLALLCQENGWKI